MTASSGDYDQPISLLWSLGSVVHLSLVPPRYSLESQGECSTLLTAHFVQTAMDCAIFLMGMNKDLLLIDALSGLL